MSGDTKRVLEVNQIDNLQGSTQRVKQETTLNNLRGFTQRVYVVGGGGGTPVIDELNVTPSTSAQTITAPSGVDGYSPVNVSAVTSAIDANITAGNIKKDVEILGVTGTYEGQTPTGTMYIISNGTYNVADKAIANVNVPTTAPAHYIEKTVDANGKLINSTNIIDLNGATDVGNYVLYYAYYQNTGISGVVDMSDLTKISGSYACQNMSYGCTGITSVDMSGLTTISADYACQSMFYGCTGLTNVDLSGLTTVSQYSRACQYMFAGCNHITSINLPSLTTVNGYNACQYMFQDCTGITSVNLSSLTTINSEGCVAMFQGCTGITSVDLSNLTTITGGGAHTMFYGCTNLKNIYLPKIQSSNYSTRPNNRDFYAFENSGLEVFDARNIRTVGDYGIFDNMLAGTSHLKTINLNSLEHIGKEAARALLFNGTNTSTLQNLYFPMLTSFGSNPFYTNCFSGRTNLTIHFRKDAQATVQALANYATLWGAGTGSSVVFDLAGTLTGADSNSYARSEKDSVYASETAGAAKTATAWSYNNTIYYTSGGAEPSVGDTIYSDSACTQAVTTISSIA